MNWVGDSDWLKQAPCDFSHRICFPDVIKNKTDGQIMSLDNKVSLNLRLNLSATISYLFCLTAVRKLYLGLYTYFKLYSQMIDHLFCFSPSPSPNIVQNVKASIWHKLS